MPATQYGAISGLWIGSEPPNSDMAFDDDVSFYSGALYLEGTVPLNTSNTYSLHVYVVNTTSNLGDWVEIAGGEGSGFNVTIGTTDPITSNSDNDGDFWFNSGDDDLWIYENDTWTAITSADGATNLGIGTRTNTDTTLEITSSTGTSAEIPEVTQLLIGLMSAADKTKLDNIIPSDNDPENIGSSPDSGDEDSYSRSDHVHDVDVSFTRSGNTLTVNVGGNTETINLSGLSGTGTTYTFDISGRDITLTNDGDATDVQTVILPTDNDTIYTAEFENGVLTLTPSSGAAQTITIPDDNTTYTFGIDSSGDLVVNPSDTDTDTIVDLDTVVSTRVEDWARDDSTEIPDSKIPDEITRDDEIGLTINDDNDEITIVTDGSGDSTITLPSGVVGTNTTYTLTYFAGVLTLTDNDGNGVDTDVSALLDNIDTNTTYIFSVNADGDILIEPSVGDNVILDMDDVVDNRVESWAHEGDTSIIPDSKIPDLEAHEHATAEHSHTDADGDGGNNVSHTDLDDVEPNDHHSQEHSSSDHSDTYAAADHAHEGELPDIATSDRGLYLRVNDDDEELDWASAPALSEHDHSSDDAGGDSVSHNDLEDVSEDNHHAQSHTHNGNDDSGVVPFNNLSGIEDIPLNELTDRQYVLEVPANDGVATWEESTTAEGTNLGIDNIDADSLDITSSTGDNATILSANTTEAGLMPSADKSKLDEIPEIRDDSGDYILRVPDTGDATWEPSTDTGLPDVEDSDRGHYLRVNDGDNDLNWRDLENHDHSGDEGDGGVIPFNNLSGIEDIPTHEAIERKYSINIPSVSDGGGAEWVEDTVPNPTNPLGSESRRYVIDVPPDSGIGTWVEEDISNIPDAPDNESDEIHYVLNVPSLSDGGDATWIEEVDNLPDAPSVDGDYVLNVDGVDVTWGMESSAEGHTITSEPRAPRSGTTSSDNPDTGSEGDLWIDEDASKLYILEVISATDPEDTEYNWINEVEAYEHEHIIDVDDPDGSPAQGVRFLITESSEYEGDYVTYATLADLLGGSSGVSGDFSSLYVWVWPSPETLVELIANQADAFLDFLPAPGQIIALSNENDYDESIKLYINRFVDSIPSGILDSIIGVNGYFDSEGVPRENRLDLKIIEFGVVGFSSSSTITNSVGATNDLRTVSDDNTAAHASHRHKGVQVFVSIDDPTDGTATYLGNPVNQGDIWINEDSDALFVFVIDISAATDALKYTWHQVSADVDLSDAVATTVGLNASAGGDSTETASKSDHIHKGRGSYTSSTSNPTSGTSETDTGDEGIIGDIWHNTEDETLFVLSSDAGGFFVWTELVTSNLGTLDLDISDTILRLRDGGSNISGSEVTLFRLAGSSVETNITRLTTQGTGNAGGSEQAARSDHRHGWPSGAGGGALPDIEEADEGFYLRVNSTDYTEGADWIDLLGGGNSQIRPISGDDNFTGSLGTAARTDHRHNITVDIIDLEPGGSQSSRRQFLTRAENSDTMSWRDFFIDTPGSNDGGRYLRLRDDLSSADWVELGDVSDAIDNITLSSRTLNLSTIGSSGVSGFVNLSPLNSRFTLEELSDVEEFDSTDAGRVLQVNSAGDGTEWVSSATSIGLGDLNDVFDYGSSNIGNFLRVASVDETEWGALTLDVQSNNLRLEFNNANISSFPLTDIEIAQLGIASSSSTNHGDTLGYGSAGQLLVTNGSNTLGWRSVSPIAGDNVSDIGTFNALNLPVSGFILAPLAHIHAGIPPANNTGTSEQVLSYVSSSTTRWVDGGGTVSILEDLNDVNDYDSNNIGDFLRVASNEVTQWGALTLDVQSNALRLEFENSNISQVLLTEFLPDTAGHANQVLTVNDSANGYDWETFSSTIDFGSNSSITDVGSDVSGTNGGGDTVARTSHRHRMLYGGDSDIVSVGSGNDAGDLDRAARANHVHEGASSTYATSTVSLGASGGDGGDDNEVSRGDHRHGLTFGTPVNIGISNSPGGASSISRSNHVHDVTIDLSLSSSNVLTMNVGGNTTTQDLSGIGGIADIGIQDLNNVPNLSSGQFLRAISSSQTDWVNLDFQVASGELRLTADGSEIADIPLSSLNTGLGILAPGAGYVLTSQSSTGFNWELPVSGDVLDFGENTDITAVGSDNASTAGGSSGEVAHARHRHQMLYGTNIQSVGTSNSSGNSNTAARSNHVHAGLAAGIIDVTSQDTSLSNSDRFLITNNATTYTGRWVSFSTLSSALGGGSYTAGSGLTLSGTQFSVTTNGISASHIAANAVGASEINANAVGVSELNTGSNTGNSGQYLQRTSSGMSWATLIGGGNITYSTTAQFVGADTSAPGTVDEVSRGNHRHGIDYGETADMYSGSLTNNNQGSVDEVARIDHRHAGSSAGSGFTTLSSEFVSITELVPNLSFGFRIPILTTSVSDFFSGDNFSYEGGWTNTNSIRNFILDLHDHENDYSDLTTGITVSGTNTSGNSSTAIGITTLDFDSGFTLSGFTPGSDTINISGGGGGEAIQVGGTSNRIVTPRDSDRILMQARSITGSALIDYSSDWMTWNSLVAALNVGSGFNLYNDVDTEITTSALNNSDRMLLSDVSASGRPNRFVTLETLQNYIGVLNIANYSSITNSNSISDSDEFVIRDTSGQTHNRVSVGVLKNVFGGDGETPTTTNVNLGFNSSSSVLTVNVNGSIDTEEITSISRGSGFVGLTSGGGFTYDDGGNNVLRSDGDGLRIDGDTDVVGTFGATGNITTNRNIIAGPDIECDDKLVINGVDLTEQDLRDLKALISDVRIKKDIVPLNSSLEKVTLLNPVTFTRKEQILPRKKKVNRVIQEIPNRTGFIAQEMKNVFPEIILTDDINCALCINGEKCNLHREWGIQYVEMIPILTKAIQELSEHNDELKERISALEGA